MSGSAEMQASTADTRAAFTAILAEIAADIGERPLDAALGAHLQAHFPAEGDTVRRLADLTARGAAEGWLLPREAGGLRFGRPVKPGGACGGFSVDAVEMRDMKGPHHVHTNGEIGHVLPIEGEPRFDAFAPGWYVYPPGSAHWPTLSGGAAYVLYFLPDGAIEFTGR